MLILRQTHRIPIKPNLTDRAKRYRAQHPDVKPLPPKQCNFCGKRQNVGVHHVTGDENDGHPDNLIWACKSCNGKIAHLMKRAGIGKRTAQYNPFESLERALNPVRMNPKRSKATMDAYAAAIKVMRGQFEGDIGKAMRTIRSTPREIRSAYTARTWPTRRAIYGSSGRQSEIPF